MSFFYNREKLLALMKNFYIITNMKMVIYDHEMKTIAAVPFEESNFCFALSKNGEALKKCQNCTINGCLESRNKKGLNIYKCHAGLIEAVTPIFIGDVIVGYMMLGQVLSKTDKISAADKIVKYARKYVGEMAKSYFDELVCKTEEEIEAATQIMESCICNLLMNHVIKEEKGKLIFEISNYIENHLSEDLLVSDLCQNFKISRNSLYRLSELYLGMPIARYIKEKRIKKAIELINEGISVTEVSEILGFCDYGYFGKVFKNVTGKTPTEIKKQR